MNFDLTIICKKVIPANGQAFISYKVKKGANWYDVVFVDCNPQKAEYVKIFDNVIRMFITVDDSMCNVRVKNGRNKLYVTAYSAIQGEKLARLIESEKAAINKYRAEQDALTRDFFNTIDAPPDMPELQSVAPSDLPF